MEAKPVRIGIVGCGRVAENHVEAVKKCPHTVLTAAAGGRRAEEFSRRHGLTLLSPETICGSELVDAVLVLTPLKTHHEYTRAALRAGKHVLVEKPVSYDEGEIEDMITLAGERSLVCMPGHSYIYLPELTRMAKTIPSGGIGKPAYAYFSETYYMPPDLIGKYEGPEIDVLCHQLYLSLAFFGKPEKAAAFRSSFPKEILPTGGPQVAVMMAYPGGTLTHLLVSWAAEDTTSDPWTFKIKILGTEGGIHFSRLDYMRWVNGNWEQRYYQEMFDCQMDYFVNRCILGGENPLSTIEDAQTVCRLHGRIMRAMTEGT
ncbi:MAG: Gfo/Idh/MocA family oxidoreductase [Treponema sp.]|jgi:predicted dehydrogenase|nr:Gfo/Idh/MocA family oxidoreductase [Treponema sp.]